MSRKMLRPATLGEPNRCRANSTVATHHVWSAVRLRGALNLVEVHILLGDGWVATVSDSEVPALRSLWWSCDKRPELGQNSVPMLFHRICDALVDSVFPILDEMDEDLDRIENQIIERA